MDDCNGVDCQNGGVCRDQIGGYECDCSVSIQTLHTFLIVVTKSVTLEFESL